MIHNYVAYSLNITSDIFFPELSIGFLSHDNVCTDVVIRWGSVSAKGLPDATSRGLTYQISKDTFWLFVPNVAYFLVHKGHEIVVEPIHPIDEDSVRAFLLEACFSALLMQRAFFLMRACVIQYEDYAVAFVGDYGLGQSTLLIDFIQAGYRILSDSICAIDSSGYVAPSFPEVRLWPYAMSYFGESPPPCRALRPSLEKVSMPIRHSFQDKKLPLRAIYHLSINNLHINRFMPMYSIQKIQCIERHIYRKYLVDELGLKSVYFKQGVSIAQQVIMADIERFAGDFRLSEWFDLVKMDLADRCVAHVEE